MREYFSKLIPTPEIIGINKDTLITIIMLFAVVAITICATHFVKLGLIVLFKRIKIHRYEQQTEILKSHKIFAKASATLIPICLILCIPIIFPQEDIGDLLFSITKKALLIYLFVSLWNFLISTLSAINDVLSIRTRKSVHGFIQTIQLLVSIIFFVLAVSTILDKSPLNILAGIGASTAVLMFVFKDTLLGFVASLQLSLNDMLQIGDWIAMDKYGADGVVIEIGLTVVKIRNWDNTITNIPTYALVSDAYQNWRGMSESGGRRIKRSILIDIQSVKFCDDTMLEQFKKIDILKAYLERKSHELELYNQSKNIDHSVIINGRRLTNLGVFRAYIEEYLGSNPNVIQTMTHFVRQLQPTSTGLPIELYFFTTTEWIPYENIQSDIFDHIIASTPYFNLRIYQEESDSFK
jgi:miniconductance mechanosensitive channel